MSARGPTHGLTSLAYAALRLLLAAVRALPRRGTRRVLAAAGRAWARLGGPRTDVARVNLAIAFPERSEAARRALLVDAFGRLAGSLVDLAELPVLDAGRARELVRLEGEEHLEAARRSSPHGGFILLTAHFGPWELFAAAASLHGYPVSVVQREQGPALGRLLEAWRSRSGLEPLRRGSAARAVLRALRDGRAVAMTLDQDTPREEGVFVPFFGRPACTRDAPARIAMRTGCTVVPGFIFPDPQRPGRHVARFAPPLELLPAPPRGTPDAEAVVENTRRMVAAVEAAIREAPAEWTWIHRRWKTGHDRRNVYKPWRRRPDPAA